MRHRCQVGITGWAQINGYRGDTSISERLQYDLYYMRNWSFGMDLQIILRTAFVAFTGTNEF
jgi:lipopolysaccharide/colanic/teichoic acid biosynthesis glycosyltransferase